MTGDVRSIHFCGICGTAMASCAAALRERGYRITGSDQGVYPPMSAFLADRGLAVMSPYREANLDHRPDLVVIGNALSRGNPEVERVLEEKMRYTSLPELLRELFLRGRRSIVVAGTHGKTTTASLMAWVFDRAELDPGFLIGGVPVNFGFGARFTGSPWFIIEGDEYDTAFFDKRSKFVHYLPEIAIVNNLEFDHADIFDDLAAIRLSFRRFINLVPRNGMLLANGDEPNLGTLLESAPCPVTTFGLTGANHLHPEEVEAVETGSRFRIEGETYELPLHGNLNLRNALAVIATARHCGIVPGIIAGALASFRGIRRRMEVRARIGGITILDDFGHHPTAIRETLGALRTAWAGRRLWAVFEPRSNTTRRNTFQQELAEALGGADRVLFSRIDRMEQLDPGKQLDPLRLRDDIRKGGATCEYLETAGEICRHLLESAREGDVICIFSNGSFGGLHAMLEEGLRRSSP